MGDSPAFDADRWTSDLRSSWTAAAPDYDRMSMVHFPPVARAFLRFAGVEEGAAVLDAACGAGLATMAAAEAVGENGKVTGVDLAPGMVELARRRARERGYPNVTIREMNAENLPVPEGSFDAAICHLGLMLFAHPDKALGAMKRAVRPGGVVSCLVQGVAERMLFTSLILGRAVKYAPQLKTPGAPTLFGYGPQGVLEMEFAKAGLAQIQAKRIAGTFEFSSPQSYWDTLTAGAGRLRAVLDQMSPSDTQALKAEVLAAAQEHVRDGRLLMPYEFVMARGVKA